METDALLDDLVVECLQAMDNGGAAAGEQAIAAIGRAHPALAPALRSRLERLREMGLLPAASSTGPPQRLGDFSLLERIGGGGMGVVYRAAQGPLRREVALKIIRPDQLHFAGARVRFAREVETVARLQHPGIVPIYTVGEEAGVPYFAMELVRGATLHEAIVALRGRAPAELAGRDLAGAVTQRGSEPATDELPYVFAGTFEEAALHVVRQVAEALDHAHRRGVIHRDLKPSNVMLTPSGRAMLLDFGLASAEGTASMTRTGAQLGSLHYMAPEQVRGDRSQVGPASDIYSLGVTLYELLTLEPAFRGDSIPRVALAIQEGRPAPLRALHRKLSWEAETVCLKAMDVDPARRYASASELARDLGNVLAGRPIEARRLGPWLRARRFWQRRPATVVATSLALLLVAGAPTFFAFQEHRASQRIQREHTAVLRLSAMQDLQDLVLAADALWPVRPEQEEAYTTWIHRARALVRELPEHRAMLAQIEGRGRRTAADAALAFDHPEDRWWHVQLVKLVAALEALADPDHGLLDGFDARLGLSIQRRLDLGRELDARSRTSADAQERWAEAANAIALADAYGGLELAPQFGLVPLGPDPDSGLLEFCHAASGSEPERDRASGRLVLAEDAAIVLVLVPGGETWTGAQRTDPAAPNHDPGAKPEERVYRGVLAPYFIGKFELTQAQWQAAMGHNPSYYGPNHETSRMRSLLHPVETVSHDHCREALRRLDLVLPTEAQWEHAARAGTRTPWWTGADITSVGRLRAANIADQAATRGPAPPNWGPFAPWDDGHGIHAPVGSFSANPFGLHDVLGNVWEWCRDPFTRAEVRLREGDGLREPLSTAAVAGAGAPDVRGTFVFRGGSFTTSVELLRVTGRSLYTPDHMYLNVGVRAARPLDP